MLSRAVPQRLSMESPAVTFTLAYVVFAVCFVFPPDEVRSAGLTVQGLLASWLGSEDAAFVQYHLRRSTGTLLAHSLLPLGETPGFSGEKGAGTHLPPLGAGRWAAPRQRAAWWELSGFFGMLSFETTWLRPCHYKKRGFYLTRKFKSASLSDIFLVKLSDR